MHIAFHRWRNRWLLAIAFVGISVGIATAYFTGSSWLSGQVLGTSALSIQVEQMSPETFAAFIPGEPQEFTWKVRNTGNAPVHLAARFSGEWENPALITSMFRLTAIAYQITGGQSWQPIAVDSIISGQPWFLSPTGLESELVTLDEDSELFIRGNFVLAESADNSYQMTNFPLTLQVIAKQTTNDAVWPEYE
jgi:hypothetical protein